MTGRCLTWDESADGHCFADNCAFICLKRITERVDGVEEHIQGQHHEAVIASAVLNASGRTAAMHAPSAAAEQELLAIALKNANISASSIDGIECNGRGGFMSDCVEVDAIERVLRSGVDGDEAPNLMLGATKSRMGNGMEGFGMSALIKGVMSAKAGYATPNCHLYTLNPHIDFDSSLNLCCEGNAFANESMYCGVTARGFSGTNAHVLVFAQMEQPLTPERKLPELAFWPGGGGEMDTEKTAFRGYQITGTFSQWKPQAMNLESDGSYNFTVTMGDSRWEEFQILLDGDAKRILHPGGPQAAKASTVYGPDANAKGLNWRITGRPLTQAAASGQGALTESAAAGAVLALHDLGSASAVEANEGQAGDRYRVSLKIAGKYQMVTWTKLPGAADTSKSGSSSYGVAGDFTGWGISSMTQDGTSWTLETRLLRDGGEFQVVRNEDWGQVISPGTSRASPDAVGLGPEDLTIAQGHSWSLNGAAGDVFRITLKHQEETCNWAVSWTWLRKEALSDAEAAASGQPRFGIVGSWGGFLRQRELQLEPPCAGDEQPRCYSCVVAIGPQGTESFQLTPGLSMERIAHPDRYVGGAGTAHRVMESWNDGMASDLVWTIGEGMDQASAGDHFRVTVTASSRAPGRAEKVTWARASGAEVEQAASSGFLVV